MIRTLFNVVAKIKNFGVLKLLKAAAVCSTQRRTFLMLKFSFQESTKNVVPNILVTNLKGIDLYRTQICKASAIMFVQHEHSQNYVLNHSTEAGL